MTNDKKESLDRNNDRLDKRLALNGENLVQNHTALPPPLYGVVGQANYEIAPHAHRFVHPASLRVTKKNTCPLYKRLPPLNN